MKPYYEQDGIEIFQGDCREVLRQLPEKSVQCCVTSPPYFGLRDYGHDDQIGLEATPVEFVAALVAVFREVWRVLKDDGTVWLNLGDSYSTHAGGRIADPFAKSALAGLKHQGIARETSQQGEYRNSSLPEKNLIGIPWRVAFALQGDGWYLRSDIIWSKPNPMPESVTDRPTKAHEYIFLLSKSAKYFYDADAIREPIAESTRRDSRIADPDYEAPRTVRGFPGQASRGGGMLKPQDDRRNKRTVWEVNPTPCKEAHFATFPPKLIEPCILAGSRPGDTVLDPFNGAGTTSLVAKRLGRRAVGAELNAEYIDIAAKRLGQPALITADDFAPRQHSLAITD